MGAVGKTTIGVRFGGDDLDPDEITRLLGGTPHKAVQKGELWTTPKGRQMPSRTGMWQMSVPQREPGDLDGQIDELFGALSQDLPVWRDLSRRFSGNLFCGLFLGSFNEGVVLSPHSLQILADRGLELQLDTYAV